MKVFKNLTIPFLAILLVSMVFVSCQKDSDQPTEQELKEAVLAEVAAQKAAAWDAITNPDSPQYKAPVTGNSTCYNAGLVVDANCDYVYELGWNEETFTWGACWNKVGDMAWHAIQQGWCWYYPENNCNTYTCDGPSPYEPDPYNPVGPCPDGC